MFSDIRAFRTRRLFLVGASPTKYSQGFFELPRGGQKTEKNKGFLWLSVFFLILLFYHLVSSWSPVVLTYLVVCKCGIRPWFLTLLFCFRSLRWLCFLFLFIFMSGVFFNFHTVVCLCCLLSWCDKKPDQMRKYLTILFSCLCFGACIPTLSLGPTNNPTRPREEPLEMVYFCLASCSINNVLKYLFYSVFFTHQPKCNLKMFPTKWVPIKTIMFHKVQNKNRCFTNGLLRNMKTFMFTKTQNLNNEKQR